MADGSTTQTFSKIIDDLEQLTGYEIGCYRKWQTDHIKIRFKL